MSTGPAEWTCRGALAALGVGPRIGLAFVVLVLLGGQAAALWYMVDHHQGKDDRPGLSLDDLRGVYHGVRARAPLIVALESGHHESTPAADRDALLDWLLGPVQSDGTRPPEGNPRLAADFDNFDLGDRAPAEVLARSCVSCHGRSSADAAARRVPLEYWDDVKVIAFSKDLAPVPLPILAVTTHTHALSLGVLTIVAGALLLATRWPRALSNGLALAMGVGLAFDIGGWWLARWWEPGVLMVVGAGAVYQAATALSLGLVLADLAAPRRRRAA